MYFAGIDPGMSGAIALLRPREAKAWYMPVSVHRQTLPGRSSSGKPRVKTRTFADLGSAWRLLNDISAEAAAANESLRVYLEEAHARPTDGVASAFCFGRNLGNWEALLSAAGLAYELVSPAAWRPRMLGTGATKAVSLQLARRLFPMVEWKGLKKEEALADALLIAEFARRREQGAAMPRTAKTKKKDPPAAAPATPAAPVRIRPPSISKETL